MNERAFKTIHVYSTIRTFIAIGLAVLCQARLARAQTPPTTRPTVKASIVVPKLQQAYNFLASADNDYQGHRDEAMKELADTAQLLGQKLHQPTTGQKQQVSDLQIRSVQMTLLQIGRSVPAGDNNAPVVDHLNAAISQLAQGISSERAARPADDSSGSGPSDAPAGRAGPGVHRGPIMIDNPIGTNMVEVGALDDIYETLAIANHDYKGHRVKSMNAIRRVVVALGANITGNGRGGEQQIVSDQQLHYAQTLLEQVCQSFTLNDPKAILNDLTTAYNELTTALSIR